MDMKKEKRVRFEDQEAIHSPAGELDRDSSVPYGATEVRESIKPKTSEYASFKKLKQDFLQNCCPYPSHRVSGQLKSSKSSNCFGAKRKYEGSKGSIHTEKASPVDLDQSQSPRHVAIRHKEIPNHVQNCIQKLKTPSVMKCPSPLKFDSCCLFSSAEYVSSGPCRHGEIFSMKRQKLRQWIAKATSLESDAMQKGYDCIALLLNRLFPESSKSDQPDGKWSRPAECETKFQSSAFLNKDTLFMQNGTPVRNLMRTEDEIALDRDAFASWCDKLGDCTLAKKTVRGSNFHSLECAADRLMWNKERVTDGDLGNGSQCWCNERSYRTPSVWQADGYSKLAICGENRAIIECEPEERTTDRDYFFRNGSQYWCSRPSYKTPSLWQTDDYGKLAICGPNRSILACEPEERTDRDYLGNGSQYWCSRPSHKTPSLWQTDGYGKLAICGANRTTLECEQEERATDRDYILGSGSHYWCDRPSYKTPSLWQTDDYDTLDICGANRSTFECELEKRTTDREYFSGSGSQYWCDRPSYKTPSLWQTDDYGKLAICGNNRNILDCEQEGRVTDHDYFLGGGSQYRCNKSSYKTLSESHTDYRELPICGKNRTIFDCDAEEDMFLNVSSPSWYCRSGDRVPSEWDSSEGSGSLGDFKMTDSSSWYNSARDVTATVDVPSALCNFIKLDGSDCVNDFQHSMEPSSLFVFQDGNHLHDLSAIDSAEMDSLSHSPAYQYSLGRNGHHNSFSPLVCDSWVHIPPYRYKNHDVGKQNFEEPYYTADSASKSRNFLLPHYFHWLIGNMVHERKYPSVEAILFSRRHHPDLMMTNSFEKNYVSDSHALLSPEISYLLMDMNQMEKSRNREIFDNLIEHPSTSLLISPGNGLSRDS